MKYIRTLSEVAFEVPKNGGHDHVAYGSSRHEYTVGRCSFSPEIFLNTYVPLDHNKTWPYTSQRKKYEEPVEVFNDRW